MSKKKSKAKKTISIYIEQGRDESQPLADEIVRQIKALEICEVIQKKDEPAPNTLPIDCVTVLIYLQITYWTIKTGKIIFDTIREARSRVQIEATKKLPYVYVTYVTDETESSSSVIVPKTSNRDEDNFIKKMEESR